MANHIVLGIASSVTQAEDILMRLRVSGFSTQDVSVLMPDRHGTRDFAHENNTKAPEGAAAGAGAGGVLGGVIGALAGIGALAIPGLGPLIAAGPILAALSGVAVGGTIGGLAGGLVGLGIPEIEAKVYEGKIRDGNILLSVHTRTSEETIRAREILDAAGARDVKFTSTHAAPS